MNANAKILAATFETVIAASEAGFVTEKRVLSSVCPKAYNVHSRTWTAKFPLHLIPTSSRVRVQVAR